MTALHGLPPLLSGPNGKLILIVILISVFAIDSPKECSHSFALRVRNDFEVHESMGVSDASAKDETMQSVTDDSVSDSCGLGRGLGRWS